MNKQQLTTILQASLFAFDRTTGQEIMNLNPDYDTKLVKTGIKLLDFLQEKIK